MVKEYNRIILLKKLAYHPFFIRLFHWEYWNSRVVYFLLYPYWLWLSIKARSFFFLVAANPSIRNGGFIMESKKDVYALIPQQYYPLTLRFDAGAQLNDVLRAMRESNISFPCIVKPDIGERGLAVKKVNDETTLESYIHIMPVAFLIQEYIAYEKEAGIFYCRIPGKSNGFISGIVHKEPVAVLGDGVLTIEQLAMQDKRYILQLKAIRSQNADRMQYVPFKNERVILVPYGNHSRGSKFTDISSKVSDTLTDTINKVCASIDGFYFGRLDIRYQDWESLEKGESFSVIELNGSGSEPTHIYDPAHSLFYAWREIIRHWNIMYRIAKANHKNGTPYLSLVEGRKEVMAFRKICEQLSARVW